MARPTYKIPAPLKRSMLDHEIVISTQGMQLKPVPLKVVLYWLGVLMLAMLLVSRTFIGSSGMFLIVLFLIWLFAAAVFFGQYSKTKEMKFQQIPAMIQYSLKHNRRVMTRNSSNPFGFMTITGIRSIDEDGLITFVDGSVGQLYSVVGTGSRLLFDGDKDAIIARVKSFWEKIDTTCEWTFITMREPQQITQQVAAAERRNYNLTVPTLRGVRKYPDADPRGHSDLHDLLQEQYELLQHVNGVRRDGSKGAKFMSIHQYLLIRASSLENLQFAHGVLEAEVNASSAMFKQCRVIDSGRKTVEVLKTFYQGREKVEVSSKPKAGSLAAISRDRRREQLTDGLVKSSM